MGRCFCTSDGDRFVILASRGRACSCSRPCSCSHLVLVFVLVLEFEVVSSNSVKTASQTGHLSLRRERRKVRVYYLAKLLIADSMRKEVGGRAILGSFKDEDDRI